MSVFATVLAYRYAIVRLLREQAFYFRKWRLNSQKARPVAHMGPLTCFVINLEHRADRWASISGELDEFDFLQYERLPATKFSPGYIGCNFSQLMALGRAAERNLPAVMICEDDITFLANPEQVQASIQAFLASDADVLCIGHLSKVDAPYDAFFKRSFHTQTASCYVVKQSAYGSLIHSFTTSLSMAFNGCEYSLCAIDQHWKALQLTRKFLIPNQKMAVQAASYSDVENRLVDYQF